jgi:hypothetical protein
MRTSIACLVLVLAAVTLVGCSGSTLSDADVTRLCELNVRCSGGAISQAACESITRDQREAARAAGCAVYFGAAGRCAIRSDSCGLDSDCADHAARLESCLDTRGDTGPGRDAGPIIMLNDSGTFRDSAVVTPSSVRLGVGGAIEILHDGRWGPICDDGFSMTEAEVACRHLGFAGAAGYSTITGSSSDFWLDDVSCLGSEQWLDQCSHSGWGAHNCSASETQAVECF